MSAKIAIQIFDKWYDAMSINKKSDKYSATGVRIGGRGLASFMILASLVFSIDGGSEFDTRKDRYAEVISNTNEVTINEIGLDFDEDLDTLMNAVQHDKVDRSAILESGSRLVNVESKDHAIALLRYGALTNNIGVVERAASFLLAPPRAKYAAVNNVKKPEKLMPLDNVTFSLATVVIDSNIDPALVEIRDKMKKFITNHFENMSEGGYIDVYVMNELERLLDNNEIEPDRKAFHLLRITDVFRSSVPAIEGFTQEERYYDIID